jgi:predicted  nucleic acid-binding Zn-ribbon protein
MTEPFDTLATIAHLDAALITLERSRSTLPSRVALEQLKSSVEAIDRALALVAQERLPLDATVESLDEEANRLGSREREVTAALASATGAGRELEAMDGEVHRLSQSREALEEKELELLEALEPLDERQRVLTEERMALLSGNDALVRAFNAEEAALDATIAERHAMRDTEASHVDPGLLARYDKIAARSDGVGAAVLEHGHCSGCHLSLSAVELDNLKKLPIDTIAYCEQCARILLRPEQLG